jgi:uncharacterized protein
MLTSAEAILEFDDNTKLVRPDRLGRVTHGHYLAYAEKMLAVYRQGAGRPRRDLHREIELICASLEDCSSRRIAAFCKLLDDVSEYDTDRRGHAAKLRKQVFSLAAPLHPLVSQAEGIFSQCEATVKAKIAAELGTTWEEIDQKLFADVIEFQRLRSFAGYPDSAALLARYNVAQTQAALYHAEHLTVWSQTDHKSILRYAKLARLMHSIGRQPDGSYCFRFDGPASVLRRSTRYGVALARFLPGLLSCRDWRAVAKMRDRRGWNFRLELSSRSGLTSPVDTPAEFDSSLEAEFWQAWGEDDREGWRLTREEEILHRGQTVFTPDFTLTHHDGRRVHLEIIGFWTPEYLISKAKTLHLFRDQPILLAVSHQTQYTLPAEFATPIVYKKSLKVADVLSRLAAISGEASLPG